METRDKERVSLAVAVGLSGLLALTSAHAGHLDLSAPSHPIEQDKSSGFRSLSRGQIESTDHLQIPNLGSSSMHSQPSMLERVQAARRDGLPIARLWENKTALVHLGFNQKGKPGLWVVQKIH
jgi:hypothetical protein